MNTFEIFYFTFLLKLRGILFKFEKGVDLKKNNLSLTPFFWHKSVSYGQIRLHPEFRNKANLRSFVATRDSFTLLQNCLFCYIEAINQLIPF